ncbi:MAG: gamma-glutamylcyclotransferase [Nocardioidaceae bacterium]|nr:gamma-glutamylcyclotransferase [Nocardioidaceae bacterium]
MVLYAAYGSNMDPARMVVRCPHSPFRGTGWLSNWRLTFGGEEHGWDGAMATIVEDASSQVFVSLYDVTREDERELDRWELPLFRKIRLRAHTLDTDERVWLYVLDAHEGGLPSASYLGMISEAAYAAGAPDDYVRDLRHRPCRSVSE